jgi:hypothetical protein
MFTDPARVLWNATVNNAEGLINTSIDAMMSDGGKNQVYLAMPEQAKPHVDFSGAKPAYQSEMMRRDGLGRKVETGVRS